MNAPKIAELCARGTLILACLGATGLTLAEDSPHSLKANVALTSNYFFRGVSQTNNGPAVQGGFDYTYTPWGLYAGVWGSNVDSSSATYATLDSSGQPILTNRNNPNAIQLTAPGYDGASMELDLKAGWAPTFGKLGLDIGYIRYEYPMTDTNVNNTNEWHAGISYDVMGYFTPKATANYSEDFYGLGESWYYDLTVTVPLPWELSLVGHYGMTRFNNSFNNGGSYSYDDYSASLSREIYAGVVGTVAWVDRTDTDLCAPPFQCGSSAVFTLSKSF
jgi:uncharacterized protein (TIGR02001 family)